MFARVHRTNGCLRGTGRHAQHCADLEAIRIALGEPSLNYLGYSYGTVLGMTYAQMFPATMGAMVLDGPPDYWLPQLDYAHQQAQAFMQALDAFLGGAKPARRVPCAKRVHHATSSRNSSSK